MSAALADLEAWRDRYRMCVRTDPQNSERRWRAVAGWAAAHVELEPAEPEPSRPTYGLDVEAWEWLEDAEHRRGFKAEWSTFTGSHWR